MVIRDLSYVTTRVLFTVAMLMPLCLGECSMFSAKRSDSTDQSPTISPAYEDVFLEELSVKSAVRSGAWVVYFANRTCGNCPIAIGELAEFAKEPVKSFQVRVAIVVSGSSDNKFDDSLASFDLSNVVVIRCGEAEPRPAATVLLRDGVVVHRFSSRMPIALFRSLWL